MKIFNNFKKIYESVPEIIQSIGMPWSNYVVLRDILKIQKKTRLTALKKQIIKAAEVKNVYHKLLAPQLGVPSITIKPASHKVYGSYYWGLRFLADVGITSADFRLDEIVHQIFIHQMPDGQFTINYRRKNKIPITAVCLTANLAYSIAALGYQFSRGIQAAINFILTTQRQDGGWHCDLKKQVGERDEDAVSCPSANINVIRALSVYGDRYQHIIKQAVEQIFEHWKNRSENFRQCDFGIGTTFMKLRYPPHYWGYDILNVLDTLSFYPELCRNETFDEMMQQVVEKWDGKGLFKPEKSIPEWSAFNFAKKNNYSCWISCLICRVLARVYFF